MPRKKLESGKSVRKKCDCCGTRFGKRVDDWRKQKCSLKNMTEFLLEVNSERIRIGQQPLTAESFVCRQCQKFIRSYSSSQSSSQTTTSDSEDSDSSIGEDPEAAMEVVDPPFNPMWQGDEIGAQSGVWQAPFPGVPSFAEVSVQMWQGVDNAAPGPSRLAGSARAPWEERCLLCPLLFGLNQEKQAHKLADSRLLQVLINGEMVTGGQPIPHPGSLLCDSCFMDKIEQYRRLIDEIRRPAFAKEANQLSEGSNVNAMDISETASQDQNKEPVCTDSSEEESSASQESEIGTPPSKRSTTKQTILLDIPSVAVSGHLCFVCGKEGIRKRVGKKCRLGIFRSTGIYVHPENRICAEHQQPTKPRLLTAEGLAIFLAQVRYDETFFTPDQILELTNFLQKSLKQADACKGRLSFKETHRYSSNEFFTMLGVSKEQFKTLHQLISPYMRSTCARSTEDGLAIFLMKLRSNPSVNTLACLFNTTKQRISACLKVVRKLLIKYFVPQWLGYHHVSRREYIDNHTTITSKTLTGATEEQAIAVIDGTYFYHNKSTKFSLQRKMFNLHKFRCLIKVMIIASTRGHILSIEGPYYGDGANNDSSILKSMQKDRDGFRSFFTPGDFIIEDRGFRDSNELMTNLGFSIKMPHFLGRRSQHPTTEANESRLVTKIRWIVESVNGRIKNVFRFFRDVIPNTYIKHNAGYQMLQIACAILNAFHPPLVNDQENDKYLAEQMLVRSEMQNLLKSRLEDDNLVRHTLQWQPIEESSLLDFPRLTMSELRELTFGIYQIKLSTSYMSDTIGEDGKYDIFYHPVLQDSAIKFRIHSRHKKSKQHDLWIGYNKLNQGAKSIVGWYCRCPNGSRIVGCCAHVAAIIWFLSYARYCSQIKPPAADLDNLVRDAQTFSYENEFIDIPELEEETLLLDRGENLVEEVESSSDDEWLL